MSQGTQPEGGAELPIAMKHGSLEALCDRRQLLGLWTQVVQLSQPRLEDQGSNVLRKKQFGLCSRGETGWLRSKHIISALPETDERPTKTNRRILVDGWKRRKKKQQENCPLREGSWITCTWCRMAMLAFPSMPKLNATYQDSEDWYRWFWGKDIADRRPPPTEITLLWAERNAWREIHNLVYGGQTLTEAMDTTWLKEGIADVRTSAQCSKTGGSAMATTFQINAPTSIQLVQTWSAASCGAESTGPTYIAGASADTNHICPSKHRNG